MLCGVELDLEISRDGEAFFPLPLILSVDFRIFIFRVVFQLTKMMGYFRYSVVEMKKVGIVEVGLKVYLLVTLREIESACTVHAALLVC